MPRPTILSHDMAESPAAYLQQFDCHAHTFSHCVLSSRNLPDWNELDSISVEDKLDFIANAFKQIYTAARDANIRVQCVTEHPVFAEPVVVEGQKHGGYGVPFKRYHDVYEGVKRDFRKDFTELPLGIEVELRQTSDGVTVDLATISDGHREPKDILQDVRLLVGGLHYKYNKEAIQDTATYLRMLKQGVHALAKLRDELAQENYGMKICVLAHYRHAAYHANKAACDWSEDSEYSFDEFLCSDSAPIQFFTPEQLVELSDVLIAASVFPELNGQEIRKGMSDIRLDNPYQHTLLETYIERCKEQHITPMISVGSDDHTGTTIGDIGIERAMHCVPNIGDAVVWTELLDNRKTPIDLPTIDAQSHGATYH